MQETVQHLIDALKNVQCLSVRMHACGLFSNSQHKDNNKAIVTAITAMTKYASLPGISQTTLHELNDKTNTLKESVMVMAKREAGKSSKNQKKYNQCVEGLVL